jgi:predicted MFS family arabinose efflux permease
MSTHSHSEQSKPLLRSNHSQQTSYDAIPTTTNDGPQPSETNGIGQPQQTVEKSRAELIRVLIPLSIGIFLSSMDGTVIVSAYASMGSEFNQLQNTSWIATAYMLTLTAFQPLYGKLSDMFGRKQCLLFAYFMFALGNLFCGLARDMTELILARGFTGIGGSGMAT